MSTKKHKLSISDEEIFSLLGLVSDEPDYKLCWTINEKLHTAFRKVDDIVLFNRKQNLEQLHSIFQYDDENKMVVYKIIVNRGENGYFIPGLKNIDYFMLLQGDVNPNELSELARKLNSLNSVRMCIKIDDKSVKERDRFLLW